MVSDSSSCNDEKNPKPDPNSIDQSLDAIENQLASISMSQSVSEPESVSESEHGGKDGTMELNNEELRNGLLNEIESLSLHSSLAAEVSRVEKEVEVEGDEQEQEPEASSSRVWRNVSEVEEVEAPSSPSSSGYVGERGSSSTSGIEEDNHDDNDYDDDGEIHEVRNDGEFDEVSDSQAPWIPGKRHGDEVSLRN